MTDLVLTPLWNIDSLEGFENLYSDVNNNTDDIPLALGSEDDNFGFGHVGTENLGPARCNDIILDREIEELAPNNARTMYELARRMLVELTDDILLDVLLGHTWQVRRFQITRKAKDLWVAKLPGFGIGEGITLLHALRNLEPRLDPYQWHFTKLVLKEIGS